MVRATPRQPDHDPARQPREVDSDASPLALFRAGTDAHIGQTLTRLAALAAQQHLAQLQQDEQYEADVHTDRDERHHGEPRR